MITSDRKLMSGFLFLLTVIGSAGALAHHGVNGQFDVSKNVELSGQVTGVRLVNPHAYVYVDVINGEGVVEAWSCEMSGASLLRRNGWSEEMFATGSAIKITGNPSRNGEFSCAVGSIVFPDGQVVGTEDILNTPIEQPVEVETEFVDGIPNLSGNWIALFQQQNRGGAERAAPDSDGRPPRGVGERPPQEDGERPPQQGGGRGPQVAQSEAGIAAGLDFNPQENPRLNCQTTNIFLDWIFNEQVNQIVQSENSIIMNYGFMEMISRTIHLDMESHPDDLVPSIVGHSIGKWEGDTLVVDTIGFAEGYLSATGRAVKHSEEMHVVERFSLSEDGNRLDRTYIVNDPLYLTAPYEGSDFVVRTSFPFQEYDCVDLTQ